MDFIQLINTEWAASNAIKLAMLEDFTDYHGYQTTVTNELGEQIPNPETRKAFANKVIIRFIKESTNAKRAERARAAATYEPLDLQ